VQNNVISNCLDTAKLHVMKPCG